MTDTQPALQRHFKDAHLGGASFENVDLSGSRFHHVDRAIEGDPSPWHPLDLPWDQMPDTPGMPRDRDARPTLDEALALRQDRAATVRRIVDGLTDEQLASDTTPVEGAGWPPPQSFPVRDCLLTVLNEEWEHRLYAERDLDALLAS